MGVKLRVLFALTALLALSQSAVSQVVIARQGFDSSTADNWSYTPTTAGGQIATNNTRLSSPPFAMRLRASLGTQDPFITFDDRSLAGFSNVSLSVAYASDGTPDLNDNLILQIAVSTNGGATYDPFTDFPLILGQNGTGDDLQFGSTLTGGPVSNPAVFNISSIFPTATHIRVRVQFNQAGNDSNNDFYFIDDLVLTGLLSGVNEMEVNGLGNTVTDGSTTVIGSNGTDFGSTQINLGTVTRSFTIKNNGDQILNLTRSPDVAISGNPDFSILSQPAFDNLGGGQQVAFQIQFAPTSTGLKNATITIANTDSDENPYTFAVQGSGIQTFIDTDGDAVTNDVDIDDDNDGIPDTIEQDNCAANPVSNVVEKVFINETFGAGTNRVQINANIPTATTNYCYENGVSNPTPCTNGGSTNNPNAPGDLNDGEYTVFNSAQIASWAPQFWYTGPDHTTGDTNGRMALFNAAITPGEFYRTIITGAFPNLPITYDFWAINLDRDDAPSIGTRLRPNVLIEFRDLSGNLITSISTGDIAPSSTTSNQPTDWHNFTANITLGNFTEFEVIFINNTIGGLGNDLALDDIVIKQTFCNSDNDFTPDVFDLDADNDGIPDIVEVGFAVPGNDLSGGFGRMDLTTPSPWIDLNGNGLHDQIDPLVPTFNIISTDSDGILDQFDLDSDNDGIFDVEEAGLVFGDGDVNGDGMGDGTDSDDDGILDIFDFFVGFGNIGQPLPDDTDGDGLFNYMEPDYNNDGVYDIEDRLHAALDTDNDGIINGSADIDRDGILDIFDTDETFFGSPRDLNEKLTLEFDGRNDYMEEAADLLQGSASATMMAWINPSNISSNPVIMGEENITLSITNTSRLRANINGTIFNSASGITIPMNKWSHIALVFDGSANTARLYLNGDEVGINTSVGSSITATASNSFKIGRNPTASNSFYGGLIDEVRVFNVALTADQLRRMVYQEVAYNGAAVDGATVPLAVPGLNSANMLRYFRMDTYKDDIADNLSTPAVDIGTGCKIYNVKQIRRQTAPVPFVTATDGNWNNPATWLHDDVWDISNEANNSPWSIVHIAHNVTAQTSHGLIGLLVDSGQQLTVEDNLEMRLSWYLKLDGKMDLVGESQLIQSLGSVLDNTSSGTLERDQQGTADEYSYNYWSFPVGISNNSSNNNINRISNLRENNGSLNFLNTIQPLPATTPVTLSTRWMYKFEDAANNINNWKWIGQNGDVQPGQGFIMKGPGTGVVGNEFNYIFEGKPNNATISHNVSGGNILLVGNPYASTLDANRFIDDNINSITGTLYFWEHFAGGTHILLDYQGGYATRTKTMGVAATQHPDLNPSVLSGSKVPTQFIPVAQSFFVVGDANGGLVEFNNSQRTFVTEASGNSVFTKANKLNEKSVSLNANSAIPTTKSASRKLIDSLSGIRPVGVQQVANDTFPRVKINFIGPKGFFRQIGAGFPQTATPAFDNGWDALLIDKMPDDFYWKANDDDLVIQAQSPLTAETVLPIEVQIQNPGTVQIGLESAENLPENMDILLSVTENGQTTYHDLSEDFYEGTIDIGLFPDKFSLVFREQETLSLEDEILPGKGFRVYFEATSKVLRIDNPNKEFIESVMVYNMLGQVAFKAEVQNNSDAALSPDLKAGVYIIKVNQPTAKVVKKIIIN